MPKHPPHPSASNPASDQEAPTAPVARSGGGSGVPNSSFMLGADRNSAMPQTIDRYRIIREIGRGGMGVVYLAKRSDETITAPVALKVLKRGLDTDHIVRRFNLERQLLGALTHPNIARLLDAGSTSDGLPYLVMEYIEGEALDKHCDTAKLTVPQRLRLFQKVCAGVHALHQNLVVHRDLKPTNILVTPNNEPKLLDLGIAKLVNPVMGGLAEQTVGDHQLMTPEYASPEQVAGRAITTASDIYSLGMILYELLTGERAYQFANRTTEEIRRVVCDVDPEKPSTRVGRIIRTATLGTAPGTARGGSPESAIHRPATAITKVVPPQRLAKSLEGDLDDIIMMALEKIPSRRYASAQDMAGDIERYLADEPVTARKTSRRGMYRAVKFVHRNRKGVAFAAGGALVLAASTAVAVTGWQQANAAKEIERQAKVTLEGKNNELKAQRDVAETQRQAKVEALNQGMSLVMSSLTGTYNEVKKLESPTDALQGIVDAALTYAREVARQNPDDLRIKAMVGETYEKLGILQYSPDAPHLGQPTAAAASLSDCINIREGLAAVDASNVKLRLDLWQAYRFAGQVAQVLGKPDEAERFYGLSLKHADADASKGTSDPALRKAITLGARNESLRDLGRWKEAEQAVLESLREREAQAAAKPDAADLRTRLASGLQAWGEFLLDAGRPAEAVEPLRKNLTIREALLAGNPDVKGLPQRAVANAQVVLGQALVWSNRIEEGLALMQRAEAALDAAPAASEDPHEPADVKPPGAKAGVTTRDARKLNNLAEIAGRLAAAYLRASKPVEAEAAASRQVSRAQELVQIDEKNIRARMLLADGMRVRARALLAQGKGEAAVKSAEEALAAAARTMEMAPASGRAKRGFALAVETRIDVGGVDQKVRADLANEAVKQIYAASRGGESMPFDQELAKNLLNKASGK
jgi:serine/threonine protein kinase